MPSARAKKYTYAAKPPPPRMARGTPCCAAASSAPAQRQASDTHKRANGAAADWRRRMAGMSLTEENLLSPPEGSPEKGLKKF